MNPISGRTAGMLRAPAAVDGGKELYQIRQPGEEVRGRPRPPAMDTYTPEEKREPAGLYWPERDGEGRPKICFDDPDRAGTPDRAPGAPEGDRGLERRDADGRAERCTGDTGRVDREIAQLKKRRQALEQQIGAETDAARREDLEKQLAQVERELRQKDNDAYRRRHTVFS